MRNRAKCALCKDIIETHFPSDYQHCSCGEIAIDGIKRGYTKHQENFLHLNDDDTEEALLLLGEEGKEMPIESTDDPVTPKKEELIDMLDQMIKTYENLPQHALHQPVSYYDHLSLLLLMSSILRAS